MLNTWPVTEADPAIPEARAALSEWLNSAVHLDLDLRPGTAAARAFVDDLVAVVMAYEDGLGTRSNDRGARGREKLLEAVAAVAGAVLKGWAKTPPVPVYRSLDTNAFTGSPVGRRQFNLVKSALASAKFVVEVAGINPGSHLDFGGAGGTRWHGTQARSARFWPGQSLLDLAIRHGLTPATVKSHFQKQAVTKAPKVVTPIRMEPLRERPLAWQRRLPVETAVHGNQDVPPIFPMTAAEEHRLAADVEAANAFAGQFAVTGCTPPRWYRKFTASRHLGGRWINGGREGTYQNMERPARTSDIRIGGKPVVEVDVSSTHLTIMHGLLGLPLPRGDLYDFAGISRDVAKVWVVVSLGNGGPALKWSANTMAKHGKIIGSHKAATVAAVLIARFPFLEAPAAVVESYARLDRLTALGTPARLLTHRLMNIEAECITMALTILRSQGVLALPVHDSLIVPSKSKTAAMAALRAGFEEHAGIVPKVKISV